MGSSINRTTAISLKNKAGQTVTRGDVVIIDSTTDESFTLTTGTALATDTIGVVLDEVSIPDNGLGMIAIGGYVPQINLISGANLGDSFYITDVKGNAIPHSTILPGDFGQVLKTGLTPSAILWGVPK